MNSFFTLHSFLEVGKTKDVPSKFCKLLEMLSELPREKSPYPIKIRSVLRN
jgi:hypothetical protein